MSDSTYISEQSAMNILRNAGDFTQCQAKIVLMHSLKQSFNGADYYPMKYIYKRARDNAARQDPEES